MTLNDIVSMTSGRVRTQEELEMEYTPLKIQKFQAKEDAPIDDKNILTNPDLAHLTKTHKPTALLNTLKQKES